tara:strand:+ start:156 stop:650 length:495 start_codon:yes stop_codon:yes gene_type:complete
MSIILKNKHTLQVNDFYFTCCIGQNGTTNKKQEGDKKTPKGNYSLEHLYYRKDKIKILQTKIKTIKIKKEMGWCDDPKDTKNYNKLIKIRNTSKCEKLYRKDRKYDLVIPIKYNFRNRVMGKGSCIFIHLTNNYKPTAGCIALKKKDFLIMLKLINKRTRIVIN